MNELANSNNRLIYVDPPLCSKNGIYLKTKIAIVVGVILALVFAGSILATYFGKTCPKQTKVNLFTECSNAVCANQTLINLWTAQCPATTITTGLPITTSLPTTTTTTIPEKINFRLPKDLIPTGYDLTIKPYIGENAAWTADKVWTFEGNIVMHFTCDQPTNKLIFHSLNLDLDTANMRLESPTDNTISVDRTVQYDSVRDFVIVTMNKQCQKSVEYSFHLAFGGKILESLYGFYRSSFVDQTGQRSYLATTKFEPTYARRAFPCFDEPAMKTTYNFSLIRHRSFGATYFNTPLLRSETNGEWITDYFEKTVKMSTYLVAYVIANFKQISRTSPRGNLCEVVARPQAIDDNEGEFALQESVDIVDFFEDYFNVDYPLQKITHLSVPDFNSGAMENWGLIIYRETSLLYNPNRDTITNKRRVSTVVSHELSHQWFGNLVSPLWWNDLWLNEGFASWVEYLGYNKTHPEWRDVEYFFVQNLGPFVSDSLETSHPISVEVNDPNDITSLFDGISYGKGASIIRMMNAFLTEQTFKRGVTNYLNTYAYSNAEQDNLWEQLTLQAHADGTLDRSVTIKQIMDTWTLQKGYPLVTVTRSNNQIRLTQKWFLLNPLNTVQGTPEYDNYRWYIPFTYTTSEQLNFDFESRPSWFTPQQSELTLNLPRDTNADSWIIGNIQHSGFYRINYDQNNWKLLIDQLNTDHLLIHPVHRAQLLDDSFNLGRAEVINQTIFLDTSKYLINEKDPLPFTPAFSGFNFITRSIDDDIQTFETYKTYYKNLLSTNYQRLGWNSNLDDATLISLQTSTLSAMCSFGYEDCIKQARSYYEDWIFDNKPLPVNFKALIYSTIALHGSQSDWFDLYEIAINRTDYTERIRILSSLASTPNVNLLKFLLSKLADTNVVRLQDKSSLLGNVAANSVGRKLAYEYMEENWNQLFADFGTVSFTLPNIVSSCTSRLNKNYDLNRVENFIKSTPNLGVATSAFQVAIENIKTNIRWVEKNLQPISKWLQENYDIKPTPINYRIPTDLSPYHYDLSIRTYFTPLTKPEYYDGSVKILFTCVKDTSKFVFHLKDIDIDNPSLNLSSINDPNFSPLSNFEWKYDQITHIVTVNLPNGMFRVGYNYSFSTNFRAYTKDDDLGFYRTSYLENDGTRKWLMTSQLEYIEARRSFPSFDEPGFKSTFTLTVTHDSSLSAMSNMPIASKTNLQPSNGYNWVETKFQESPLMPTYLLAIMISDYKCKDGVANTPISKTVNVSICARANAYDQLDLAFDSAINILAFFEEYYEVAYPLPKLDHVATPTFKFSAMENWGLAIYIETIFFFNPSTTQTTEQNIVRVIAHEISHMWFGNLVTPKWWNDLWLNEGFARFAEHLGSNSFRPTWRMFDRLYDLLLSVIQLDSSELTRPVSLDVAAPEEIDANINPTITYGKGASVVKMLEYVLGEKTFRDGLKAYFTRFAFKNVDQFDLWNTLSEVAISQGKLGNVDLIEAMRLITKQKGHPVITIKRLNSTHISVRQNRFVLDTNAPLASLTDVKWLIPFSHSVETIGSSSSFTNEVTSSNLWNRVAWLNPNRDEEILKVDSALGSQNFLIVNLDMAGFYRVNYDPEDWKLIANQLLNHRNQLSVRTRAQLVSDVFSLTEANYINPSLALDVAKSLSNEFDYLPWNVFISRIRLFLDMFELTPVYGKLQSFLAYLVEPYHKKLGWIENADTDEWTDRLYRPTIVRFACLRGVGDCLSTARQYYNDWKSTGDVNRLPRGLRSIVSCSVVSSGNQEDFDYIFNETKKITDAATRNDLLSGLSCSKEQWLLSRYLQDQLPTNAILTALVNVGSKPIGNSMAWNFLKNNWQDIYTRLSLSGTFPTLVREIASSFKSHEQYNDFVNFFMEKSVNKPILDAVNESKTKIMSNIKWYRENYQSVSDWLDAFQIEKPGLINFRLPEDLTPIKYDLTIKPYIGRNAAWTSDKDFTFEGQITMSFVCKKPTRQIIFHSLELNIDKSSINLQSNVDTGITVSREYQVDPVREFLILDMNRDCTPGVEYSLRMDYTGPIKDSLYGFYRSSYLDTNGNRQYLATTHFQPTDARRAFPCFDEPGIKAVFKFTLIRHVSFNSSFANSPLIDSVQSGDWITDRFEDTPPMSTYLVAFVIANYKQIEATTPKGVKIQVAAKPQSIDAGDGQHALDEATVIIDFFTDYFNVAYPLKKSTQIAVPDFNAGAMENWGLIIYRETDLLYNPNRDLISNKRRVSVVVSHELAHQWFGNLVTPVWWNDLWLNEGFASWVEYLGYNRTHPEWRDLDFFFVQKLGPFVQDSLETSHPISVEVNDPSEINSIFDAISYNKGSSIIRMMNAFLTEETFKKGVSNYLKKYNYSNAEQDNLWEQLTLQAHADGTLDRSLSVKQIMDTWTLQKGYPLLTVTRTNNQIKLSQKWFLLNPLNTVQGTPEYDKYRWYIPFTYTTSEQLNFDFETRPTWFNKDQLELTIDLPRVTNPDSWIIGNIQHSGFYRINYDQNNWNLLINQLNTDHLLIHPVHRAQLLDDSFNLGRAEVIDQSVFLDISKYLIRELDPLPLIPAFTGLNFFSTFFEDDLAAFDSYKTYYKNLIKPLYEKYGWSNNLNDANEINLQLSVLQTMCNYGNQDCIDRSRSFYNLWISNGTPLPVSFKTIIYSTIGLHGSQKEWFDLYEIAINRTDYTERLRILRGLASSSDLNIMKFLLAKISDTNIVRLQDKSSLINSIAANPVSRRIAYDYLEENWDQLFNEFGTVSFTLPNIVSYCTSRLNRPNDLNRLQDFIRRTGDLGVAEGAFKSAVENVKTNIKWSEKNFKPTAEWLAANYDIKPPSINYRIPSDLSPYHYDLSIRTYFTPTTMPQYYDGSVKISFRCERDTTKLVFHLKDIDVDNSSLTVSQINDPNFNTLSGFKWTYDPIAHIVTAPLPSGTFRAGYNYSFSVNFRAYSKNDDLGFYRTSYIDNSGSRRWLMASQLEYIEARKSFPSFDEPGFKSTFTITITHDSSLSAMSNMPIDSETNLLPSDGYNWVETKFKESPYMSTYLVAILISDYGCVAGVTSTKVDVNICSRPNAYDQMGLALNSSIQLLEFFEDFYEVAYPLPKLDHVSSPTFKYGAMENWGMAIYLERYLLFNARSTQSDEINVVSVVSHEISHMWFGNLVTPKWWNDLWLNEGFARYCEYLGPNFIRPDWRMMDRHLLLLMNVIQLDSSESTRPISLDVAAPEEIDANINPTITYGKGSFVVRMLDYVLGDKTFRDGLKEYFTVFRYTNVDQFDLWNTLSQVAIKQGKLGDVDLVEAMRLITKQKGHPVITVKRVNSTHISVRQNRFVLDSNVPQSSLRDVKWFIPFTHSVETIGSSSSFTNEVSTANLWNRFKWLSPDKDEEILKIDRELGSDDFLIINLDMAGVYRVNYDPEDWKLIARQLLNFRDQISVKTRSQLLSDAFSLSEANQLDPTLAFDVAKSLSQEYDFLPWNVFISRMKFFLDMMDSTSSFGKMQQFFSFITEPYFKKLGWIEDPQNDLWNDRLYRLTIVRFACQRDVPSCLNTARRYYEEWKATENVSSIPAAYRTIASCAVISSGSSSDYEYILNEANKITDAGIRNDLLSGLSCAKEQWQLTKYLDSYYSTNNILAALINVATKPHGNLLAWNYLKINWSDLYSRFGNSGNLITLLREIANRFKYPEQYNDYSSFFNGKLISQSVRNTVDESLMKILSNIKWFAANGKTLANWFESFQIDEPDQINYRLPNNIKPIRYDLTIKPYIGDQWPVDVAFTFEGKMIMDIMCEIPTRRIVFHSSELELDPAQLDLQSTDDQGIELIREIEFDRLREFAIVKLSRDCKQNAVYSFTVVFTGEINDLLFGFYRSSYVDENGQTQFLALTDFEPTGARWAFPCFDEPAMKASYKFTLIRHANFSTAFFNTPRIGSVQNGEWFTDTFEETPKMSSYLVAYVIANYNKVEKVSNKGVLIEVAGRPQRINIGDGNYSLSIAADIIDFFDTYFDVSYPLPKSTQIAIPDFNSGAMENWGLITYRESILLFNENTGTISNKRNIAATVSHELAHQWFGNLVSPAWWDDLWLNEGFASWVEYLGTNAVHPEWKDLDFFFVQQLSVAVLDSLESSHPIRFSVSSPDEITAIFDDITYSKGASIVRMMNAFLTEATFKKGVSNYLKKYNYSNAEQDNLWEQLTLQAHVDGTLDRSLTVNQIMDSWTLQKGYPLVTVTRTNNQIKLSQKWFLLNPLNTVQGTPEYDKYRWYVPFTFTTSEQLNFDFETRPTWFNKDQLELTIDLPIGSNQNTWIIANLQHSGFYRVNYDSNNWQLLSAQLNSDFTKIDRTHRAQMLDDTLNLGRAEYVPQTVFLEISKYLSIENDSMPFIPAFTGLNFIGNMIENDFETFQLYKEYYKNLLVNNYNKYGWRTDLNDANEITLQTSTLNVMCSYGFEDCVTKSREYYTNWLNSATPIPNNFKTIVYSTVIRFGTESDWFDLYETALKVDNTEKLRMMRGLAATRQLNLLQFLLSKSSDPNVIRPQDEGTIIFYISINVNSRGLLLDYMEENWQILLDKYGTVAFTLPDIVESITRNLNTRLYLNRVEELMKNNELGVARDAFMQAIENIRINIRWIEKNLLPIKTWLSANK